LRRSSIAGDVLAGRILVALFAPALAPFVAKAVGEWRALRAKTNALPRQEHRSHMGEYRGADITLFGAARLSREANPA